MDGYVLVSLNDMVNSLGEDKTKLLLSSFSCPMNLDVEHFLKDKAILFAQQGIAQTHLIYTSYKNNPVLVAYFTLANKQFTIQGGKKFSNKLRQRIKRFAIYNESRHCYEISAPLIGQIGKNFTNNYNQFIKGDEVLKLACDKVRSVQRTIGGRFVYLECEDKEMLKDFYERNGFVNFGRRNLDNDEKDVLAGRYLIQMLKYLKDDT